MLIDVYNFNKNVHKVHNN